MITRRILFSFVGLLLLGGTVSAQYTGPSVQGDQSTISAAENARPGTYLTLQGTIVSHLREDYYLFRDATGEMRVEISPGRFGGRQIGPHDTVRILGELDQNRAGRYIWVKSLTLAN
ncbi:MAG: NirD/YgiW/YdeI family stress tolerance protein [Pseudomonadota bacterium]